MFFGLSTVIPNIGTTKSGGTSKSGAPDEPAVELGTTDTVSISPEAAADVETPAAEVGTIAQAGAAPESASTPRNLDDPFYLLHQMAQPSVTISEPQYNTWIAECLEEGNGRIDLNSSTFRNGLADLLHVRHGDVEDEAVDAIFGNQDGRLDDADNIDMEQFLERLQFAHTFFEARRGSGSSAGFGAFLGRENVNVIDFTVPSLYAASNSYFMNLINDILDNNNSESTDRDQVETLLRAAGNAWAERAETDQIEQDRRQAVDQLLSNFDQVHSMSDIWRALGMASDTEAQAEFGQLLCYGLISRLESQYVRTEVEFDDDISWNDPQVRDCFVRGLLANFITNEHMPEHGETIDQGDIIDFAQQHGITPESVAQTGAPLQGEAVTAVADAPSPNVQGE